ncbi:hypothetical protein O181_088040 [Austropuccinia psidii MF-1]|uniref:Uncharacterized protein n=1 Tax=Austropuccinia psidii MF-1 TaxID=1389203 RepID=A0A9Q3IQS4_9BASI|nr:hypothetical protein [Austropuccinia psidii MF-1]
MASGDPSRNAPSRAKLKQAEMYIYGTVTDRLQCERDSLFQEENVYKKRMEEIAGFRKTDIIPIGKLQRAIDESDSESEPISESDGTASVTNAPRNGLTTEGNPSQLDSSFGWNYSPEASRQEGLPPGEDLDADVEDLDLDEEGYSGFIDADDASNNRISDSYQTDEGAQSNR